MLKGLLCPVLHGSHTLLILQASFAGISGGLETSKSYEVWVLWDTKAEGILVPELRKCWPPCQGCQGLQIPVTKAKRHICEALLHSEQLKSVQGSGTGGLFSCLVSHRGDSPWFLSMLLGGTVTMLISMGPVPERRRFFTLPHSTLMESLGGHASC